MKRILENRFAMKWITAVMLTIIIGLTAVLILGAADRRDRDTGVDTGEEIAEITHEYAESLYRDRITDISDTAALADLLELMEIEDITDVYTATVTPKDGAHVLSISLEKNVDQEDRDSTDSGMRMCSERIMALVPELEKVEWTYEVIPSKSGEEMVTVSMDRAEASQDLGQDISEYGKSAESLEDLLAWQAGHGRS